MEEDAEEESVAAAQGEAAIQAATEAAADGITGNTNATHLMALLAQLPDSAVAAADAAAATARGTRQQNDKWTQRCQGLCRMLTDAAAGKVPQQRRGDSNMQQLRAEIAELQQELQQLPGMTWTNRTWEVRAVQGGWV